MAYSKRIQRYCLNTKQRYRGKEEENSKILLIKKDEIKNFYNHFVLFFGILFIYF